MKHQARHHQDKMKIAIIGYGTFGQYFSSFLAKSHSIVCVNKVDDSYDPLVCPYKFYALDEICKLVDERVDMIILAVSIPAFQNVLQSCPSAIFEGKLVVDVLSVKMHARATMLKILPPSCDILCTHPMFGPSSKDQISGLPFMYEIVRVSKYTAHRCISFLDVWRNEGCALIEMSCARHDEYAARTQFTTHLVARMVALAAGCSGDHGDEASDTTIATSSAPGEMHQPIDTPSYSALRAVSENLSKNSFDLFFGMYQFNSFAPHQIAKLRSALDTVEEQLLLRQQKDFPPSCSSPASHDLSFTADTL